MRLREIEEIKELKTCQFPKIKHVTVRSHASSRDNSYTDGKNTLHETLVLQKAYKIQRGQRTMQGVYTDGDCVHLRSDADRSDIGDLGPNGIRDKRLMDEALEKTPGMWSPSVNAG